MNYCLLLCALLNGVRKKGASSAGTLSENEVDTSSIRICLKQVGTAASQRTKNPLEEELAFFFFFF